MSDRFYEAAICTLAGLAAILVLFISSCRSRCERTAYLQGRYNLDRATAWLYAGEK